MDDSVSSTTLVAIAELNTTLRVANRKLTQEFARIDRGTGLTAGDRKKRRDQVDWDYIRATQGARAGLIRLFADLCEFYLQATPEQQAQLRNFMKRNQDAMEVLPRYRWKAIEQVQSTGSPTWLDLALVSVALEDPPIDYRDTLRDLGELYLSATRIGIEPRAHFEKVAFMSDPKPPEGTIRPRDLLQRFEETAYFQGSVKPKLSIQSNK
jgi:hypothetical protein